MEMQISFFEKKAPSKKRGLFIMLYLFCFFKTFNAIYAKLPGAFFKIFNDLDNQLHGAVHAENRTV